MSQKRDPAWAYGTPMGSNTKVKCSFCDVTYNGGIFRHKKHLIGGYRDVKVCPNVPDKVKEEIKEYLLKKNEFKIQMNHEASMVNLVDNDEMDDDEVEVNMPMGPPSKHQRMPSSSGSGSSINSTIKGPMNLYFSQKPNEKRKGGPIDLESSRKILRDRAVSAFARWMYDAGLPFNCVNYTESFGEFIEAVGQYGPGMKPPTYHEVRVPFLKKEVEKTNKIVEEHKVQWKTYGCSIMMDKWTARNGKMVINVLVNSPRGSVFLESYDASDSSTDSNKMFNLFEKTIMKIGKENVVQVVTDNASENKKAGNMLKGVFPHIFWTPCAAHCINLMFGDIFKEAPYSTVFGKAVKVHAYINQRALLLNMMRRYTKQRNLVKPAKTRFATAFLTLYSFYKQKKNLRTLFMSTEWNESIYSKETLGKEVARHIISPFFWNDVVQALRVGGPLIHVLRMVDGEKKPPMGYIYEAMDRAKESIEKAFNYDTRKYKSVFEIIDARWTDQLHQPLHAAGHILNPGLYYKNNDMKTLTEDVWQGYHKCVERMIPDKNLQDKIGEELGVYMKADGLLGIESAIRARTLRSPGKFRHLPVVENGEVIALLDITKCLFDAISRMEKAAEQGSAIAAAVEGVERQWGNNFSAPSAFIETLRELIFKPSLSAIVSENTKVAIVCPSDPVYVAAKKMRELRVNSALITVGNKIQGILTSKDILMRVVAQNLSPELTLVEKVMTSNPECAILETTILEALHIMHDGKFLHLPIIDRDGCVAACIDVLQITHAAISMVENSSGAVNEMANTMMQKFWDSALNLEPPDDYDTLSEISMSQLMMSEGAEAGKSGYPSLGLGNTFAFKFVDLKGRVNRFNFGSESLLELVTAVMQRLGAVDEQNRPQLLYEDDEGDKVLLTTDSDLVGAVSHARSLGLKVLRLHLDYSDVKSVQELSSTCVEKDGWGSVRMGIFAGAVVLTSVGVLAYLKRTNTW